jgi:hypothetical protein
MIDLTGSIYSVLLLFFFYIVVQCQIEDSIYLLNTEDGEYIEAFDCFDHQSQRYCLRPKDPIVLQRDHSDQPCLSGGVRHSFDDLIVDRTSPNSILHRWRSTLEKVEDYTEYRHSNQTAPSKITWLCRCVHPQSFGKHCEYQLPLQTTITQLIATKFVNTKKKLNNEGDIVCYSTLTCDYGLLCLDWRDICDGVQQCMFGLDEANCDSIEFHECEEDEYRCRNGMCIPDQFFLDGDYDCMDMSDEKEKFDDNSCPYREATPVCDDRIISRDASSIVHVWSCGDGQEVTRRWPTPYYHDQQGCVNRRDQFFWCEMVPDETLWTLPSGRCSRTLVYNRDNLTECCYFLKICLSFSSKRHRHECEEVNKTCGASSEQVCQKSTPRHYPHAALILPYVFGDYSLLRSELKRHTWLFEGTVKCIRGESTFSTRFNESGDSLGSTYSWKNDQSMLCRANQNNKQDCVDRLGISSNRSVYHPAVCQSQTTCVSAYRTEMKRCVGLSDIDDRSFKDFTSQTCHRSRKYRLRCSDTEPSCLFVSRLGDGQRDCRSNYYDESWLGEGLTLSNLECTSSTSYNCRLLREYIASSWSLTTHNLTDLTNRVAVERLFRYFCDTFDDFADGSDEMHCEDWICSSQQWQCGSGQCISESWLFDGIWDCSDGSDEENFFHRLIEQNQSVALLDDHRYARQFSQRFPNGSLWIDCSIINRVSSRPRLPSIVSQPRQICFNTTPRENEHIHFSSNCDEQSVLDYCSRSLRKLFSNFGYLSIGACVSYSRRSVADESVPCACRNSTLNTTCGSSSVFRCWDANQTALRCNRTYGCPHQENEFLCRLVMDLTYRTRKIIQTRLKEFSLHLESDQSLSSSSSRLSVRSSPSNSTFDFNLHNDFTSLNRCNRGLAIRLNHSHDVCFCPPQYHGDQCQWHSDRLTLVFAVNLTHSKYNNMITDENIVIKYLILLLFDDQVIDNDEVHILPLDHLKRMTKIHVYLHYSRSAHFTKHRQHRFLNQSRSLTDYSYRIRIEAFEMRVNRTPSRQAVWSYLLDFDYLPVHRLAKILHFVDRNNSSLADPCHSNPCGLMENTECFRVLNRPSEYLCLCMSGYSGLNCTTRSHLCLNHYCSPRSLCQPDYSALIDGNTDKPYCICALNSIGRRCHVTPDACANHSCRNGGTCFQGLLANRALCWCRSGFAEETCETALSISDYTSTTDRVLQEELFVVQSFMINPILLLMVEVHRQLYRDPSGLFNYQRVDRSNIELLVLRIYSLSNERIHLLRILQTNDSSVPSTSPTQHNHCKDMQQMSE